VAELLSRKPNLAVWVQPCPHRCFSDAEYAQAGAVITEDVAGADYLLGIKERLAETLLPGKHYIFFSHTIKGQLNNRELLQQVLAQGCRLSDYEAITDENGSRTVAFGYFAGMVGALHALRMVGLRTGRFSGKAPKDYESLDQATHDLAKVNLQGLRFVLTGHGRVAMGAAQVLVAVGFTKVQPAVFSGETASGPVFTQLGSADLYALKDGSAWKNSSHFYSHPTLYNSTFAPFLAQADGLITGAYWGQGYPKLFSMQELARPQTRLRYIADISCDILGGVPCTHRASTIEAPYFDIDPNTGAEQPAFSGDSLVSMMTIDNLPSEMPTEATRHFGRQLMDIFIDDLLADGPIAQRAIVADNGRLTHAFAYLQEYVDGS